MFRCSLAMIFVLGSWLVGCVKTDEGKDGSTGAKSDASSTGPDAGSTAPDAMSVQSCKDIRTCIFNCGADGVCAARCVSSAPQAARTLYQQARACSENACPTGDIECRCSEECHGGGMCTEVVDECDEATSDPFCDGPCH